VKWLDKKRDDEVVGQRINATACPCAKCFEEVYGGPVQVFSTDVEDFSGHSVRAPAWLRKLIRRIDGPLPTADRVNASVTAGEVRRHLVNILTGN
jgi:hypothetical protein